MKTHEKYIKRCIQLAKNGLGTTYPNPLVGSVIVYNQKIIGEGWHKKAGEPHAEVNAINSVKNKDLLKNATIYVSLEPCSHFGKTPPCADLIIKNKIPNVVIGTIDPFAKVAGNGIKKLKEAGINVTVGVLEKECAKLNKRFFTFHQKKRPYIILKWAESFDCFISPENKTERAPVWISNIYSRQLVHKWRSEEQAVLVGTQTVIDDNPKLDTRDWFGNNPIRIVIDKNNRISKESFIFDNKARSIVFSLSESSGLNENIRFEKLNSASNNIHEIIEVLYRMQIQSVIIEGGKKTLQSFIDADLWDEARIFKGNTVLKNGTSSPLIKGEIEFKQAILDNEFLILRNYD